MSWQIRPTRHLPVRPNLDQLRHQARDLLRAIRRGETTALEEFRLFHPTSDSTADRTNLPKAETAPEKVKLADAQLVLARSYGLPSWPRLVQACKLIDAIWRDDVDAVRHEVSKQSRLLKAFASGSQPLTPNVRV